MRIFKNYFKLYQVSEETSKFAGITVIPSYPVDAFINELEELYNAGYMFKPTSLKSYIDYLDALDYEGIEDYEDLDKDNINC